MSLELRFRRLPASGDDIPLPAYATEGAAAFDLRAAIPHDRVHVIEPGARAVIDTGFQVAVPGGYELQIRSRSGLASKHGVVVLNAPATIDSDYRGPLRIIIAKLGAEPFAVHRGDRIAQGIVSPVVSLSVVEVDELDPTTRGDRGFGSTGIR